MQAPSILFKSPRGVPHLVHCTGKSLKNTKNHLTAHHCENDTWNKYLKIVNNVFVINICNEQLPQEKKHNWTSCVFVFCSKIFADRDRQLVFKCTFRQCRNPSLPAGSWNTAEDLFYFQFPSVLLQLLYSHLLSWVVALRQLKRNIFAFFLLCACVCSCNSYLSFHIFCILSAVL